MQKLRESYEYYYDIEDGDAGSGLRRYKNHFYDTTSFLRAQLAF